MVMKIQFGQDNIDVISNDYYLDKK